MAETGLLSFLHFCFSSAQVSTLLTQSTQNLPRLGMTACSFEFLFMLHSSKGRREVCWCCTFRVYPFTSTPGLMTVVSMVSRSLFFYSIEFMFAHWLLEKNSLLYSIVMTALSIPR
ncbi:hypothetical protein CDIK_0808 [Cucumispora dikerogammari]|nr:hypothetical protein CDIK_0808 [Cucumispora dikerogammari]